MPNRIDDYDFSIKLQGEHVGEEHIMKIKTYLLILATVLLLLFASCDVLNEENSSQSEVSSKYKETVSVGETSEETSKGTSKGTSEETSEGTSEETASVDIEEEYPIYPIQSISLSSLEEFNLMREMTSCKDEAEFIQYIDDIGAMGIENRNDLAKIVKLIDSLPKINILDGEIYNISFAHKLDARTNEEFSYAYIGTKAENGDWVRIEYWLSIEEEQVKKNISNEKENLGEACLIQSPIVSRDGILTIHTEERKPHPSYEGTSIIWIGEANGILIEIHSRWLEEEKVVTSELFGNLTISESLTK